MTNLSVKQLDLCNQQNIFNNSIRIKIDFISVGTSSKAVQIHVIGQSFLQLSYWMWVTSAICLIGLLFKLHEYHPLLLSTSIIIQILILAYRVHIKVISEDLLIVYGLGIQSTSKFFTGKLQTKFIPWALIEDIIIPETITMQQVIYFMAIQLKSKDFQHSEKLVPVFAHSWPKLNSLIKIYRYCRSVLKLK